MVHSFHSNTEIINTEGFEKDRDHDERDSLDADNIFFDKNMALKDDLLYGSVMVKNDRLDDSNEH